MLEVGSIVGGKFRIERILGQGGMGVVAVATHLQLDQQVALKVLHDPMIDDAEVVERFMREARASARLRSEHACKVSDVGLLDNGAPYIVMELLEGSDLQGVIANGTLPIATAVDHVLQACVAVAEAHALGIVHRDLKPANLFLTRRLDGTPLIKVLDFGIAKASSERDFHITRTSAIMGSPGYMSPEQLRSARDADARSDIWALGVILYQLVSGRLPFHGDSITELAVKVVMDPPAPLAIDSPGFVAIVYRCLEKNADERYPTVAALAADLAPLGGEAAARSAALVATVSRERPVRATAPAAPAAPAAAAGNRVATTLHTISPQSTGASRSAGFPPPAVASQSAGAPRSDDAGSASFAPAAGAASTGVASTNLAPAAGAASTGVASTSLAPAAGAASTGVASTSLAPAAGAASAGVASTSLAPSASAASAGVAPSTDAARLTGVPSWPPQGHPTTLQTAASQLTGVSIQPASRRRAALVLGGVALFAVAAAIAVYAIRGGPSALRKPGPRHLPVAIVPVDAGMAVAIAPRDAAGATGDAEAAGAAEADTLASLPELRAKFAKLAASHDWSAVLQLADLGGSDPQIATVVADARRQYLAEQARAIDARVKQGQCVRAKELVAAARQVVADDTTLEARARACKPHVAPPGPPPTLEDAGKALASGEFAKAFELADKLVKAEPGNAAATRIAALAACDMKDVDKATHYAALLHGADLTAARNQCRRNNIELDADTGGTSGTGGTGGSAGAGEPAGPPDGDVGDAQSAARAGEWAKALSFAEAALQRTPRNPVMLGVAVTAACHLKKIETARTLLRRLPRPRQSVLRQRCADQGVLL